MASTKPSAEGGGAAVEPVAGAHVHAPAAERAHWAERRAAVPLHGCHTTYTSKSPPSGAGDNAASVVVIAVSAATAPDATSLADGAKQGKAPTAAAAPATAVSTIEAIFRRAAATAARAWSSSAAGTSRGASARQ